MIPYYIFESTYYLFGVLPIQLWGVFVALGFLTGFFLAQREGIRKGLDKDSFSDLFVYIFLGSIIGARIWFVLFYWPVGEPRTLLNMLALWHGGMAFFGGFLGALIGGYLFVQKRNASFWQYADAVAPGLVAGHAIGRIGCYITGLHIGKETTLPWALHILNGPLQGQLRHPVVLYEFLYLLLIFGILWTMRTRWTKQGTLCAAYAVLYGSARFVNDFFRDAVTDPLYWGLTGTQYGLIVLIIVGVVFLLRRR